MVIDCSAFALRDVVLHHPITQHRHTPLLVLPSVQDNEVRTTESSKKIFWQWLQVLYMNYVLGVPGTGVQLYQLSV